jgi:thymidylate synthase
MFAYIRTNEMFRGWPKNAAGLRYLQQKFAEALQVTAGELTITSGSAHLYDFDWVSVNEYLRQPRSSKLEFDPKGDWRFTMANGKFVAEHYYNELLLQVISEPNVDRLERRILPFIHDISHALYIGREIQKLQDLDEKPV